MKKVVLLLLFTCIPFLLFGQEMVEKIEIVGNEHVTRETVLYYLSSKEGNPFSEELLMKDLMVFWAT